MRRGKSSGLSPATARIVPAVFALQRRCDLFPGIQHRRPVVGCRYQSNLLRRLIGNIDCHVVLLRLRIQFLRPFNHSHVGKTADPDLLHLTFGPRPCYPIEGIRGGYYKSSLRRETRAGIPQTVYLARREDNSIDEPRQHAEVAVRIFKENHAEYPVGAFNIALRYETIGNGQSIRSRWDGLSTTTTNAADDADDAHADERHD